MALSGMKGLQAWCRQTTAGYRDVSVTNMTTSWRDGLAFCAIIHRYRPDLIEFDSLSKENIEENNRLAFTVAESLSIPALLDVEDMVAMAVPDKLSIMTYVSQYYNFFRDKSPGGSARTPSKRPNSAPVAAPITKKISTPSPASEPKNAKASNGQPVHSCSACGKPVYLMERLTAEGKLFHRLCLKCCVCGIRLKTSNYRYKTDDKQFYCDRDYQTAINGGPVNNGTSVPSRVGNGKPSETQKAVNGNASLGSQTRTVKSTTKNARDRFFSDPSSSGGATTDDIDRSRAEAASFLSGVISGTATGHAEAQRRTSAPAGHPTLNDDKNTKVSGDSIRKEADAKKPTRPPSLPAVAETKASEAASSEGGHVKQKKLVLKIKKKKPKALAASEAIGSKVIQPESVPDRTPPVAETRDVKPTIVKDTKPTDKSGPDRLTDADASAGTGSVVVPPSRPTAPYAMHDSYKERTREKRAPSAEMPLPANAPSTAEDKGKLDREQPVPQRPPPRAPPSTGVTTTTKRKAPDRPSYSPKVVTPRFVGPRAPKQSQNGREDSRKIALRDKQLSLEDIAAELRLNEARQADMERRGVRMEKKLRAQTKGDPEEEYLIEWFALVNEKNKLLRRENELIYMAQEIDYLRRQQDIECELRTLLDKSEHTKSNKDRKREEELLQQLLNFVTKRDQIVGKLEEDRIREIEEDKIIETVMEAQGLTKQAKRTSGSTFF